jgi:hypothetical protein
MATIDFYINTTGFEYDLNTSGSGLGFFGDSGFGASVPVGSYQGTTFVSDGFGSTQGPQGQNIKYLNAGSGVLGAASSGIGLRAIPNYQSTLNIKFSHSAAVKTQNCKMIIYDRSSTSNPASGVTTKVAEIIHPDEIIGPTGSGDDTWITPGGTETTVSFANCPGPSGLFAADGVTVVSELSDTNHDWYAAISASPDSIGNKTDYGLYFSLEYI